MNLLYRVYAKIINYRLPQKSAQPNLWNPRHLHSMMMMIVQEQIHHHVIQQYNAMKTLCRIMYDMHMKICIYITVR